MHLIETKEVLNKTYERCADCPRETEYEANEYERLHGWVGC